MLHGQKISFVSIIDNDSNMVPDVGFRIWHHKKLIDKLKDEEICLIGRKTFETLQIKGPNVYVITSDINWKREGVGTIHNLDDLHLFTEGCVNVIGGTSLFNQLKDNVDIIHLYVLNNNKGCEPWIHFDMKDWSPCDYVSKRIWSYAKLEKKIRNKNT